jgi:hypothetical protein
MKGYFKLMIWAVSVLFSLLVVYPLSAAELIEPTQTLEGKPKQTTGRLTVLSEPPGQKITLDGDSLGETPAFMVEVEAGVHTLSVKDAETDIFVEAGKTVKISLHKNEFILIPVKEKQIEEPTVTEATTGTRTSRASQPRDPIRQKVDRDRRQSQQRWQNFIDGTKPAF